MTFPLPPGPAGAARSRAPNAPHMPASLAPFLDPQTGQIDVAALLDAYEALARNAETLVPVPGRDTDDQTRLRFRRAIGVPDTPDGYTITVNHPRLAVCPEVNRRLHDAAFTPAQAQLVYDLAVERVMPVIEAMGQDQRAETDLATLVEHFGGEDRWAEISRQLSAWGKAHLPRDVYMALASTREGVLALSRMMAEGEPGLVPSAGAGGAGGGGTDETDLKALMRDPRYWKHRDPTVVRRVAEGFRRLYPGGA